MLHCLEKYQSKPLTEGNMRKNAAKKILAVLFALVLILGTGMQALASPESPENDKEANESYRTKRVDENPSEAL